MMIFSLEKSGLKNGREELLVQVWVPVDTSFIQSFSLCTQNEAKIQTRNWIKKDVLLSFGFMHI